MRKKRYSYNIGVLLDEKMYQSLIEITDQQELTMSKYIRDMLKEKFAEELEEA